jgi:hypothetical protein
VSHDAPDPRNLRALSDIARHMAVDRALSGYPEWLRDLLSRCLEITWRDHSLAGLVALVPLNGTALTVTVDTPPFNRISAAEGAAILIDLIRKVADTLREAL